MLDESTFEQRAGETLDQLEAALADLDENLDVSLSMGVLTLQFEGGPRFVINSHRAARQIWMAAGATAWHYDWTGDAWVASKSGDELWATTARVVGAQLGRPVALSADRSSSGTPRAPTT